MPFSQGAPLSNPTPEQQRATLTGAQIVSEVMKFDGFPYVWGATGPKSFDCSGLVVYVLDQLGIKGVPRTSEQQWGWVHRISKSDLQPGDLVFANFGTEVSPGHVGVYLGNGQVLSAQSPASGVGVSSLKSWGSNIVGYGRVPGTSGTPASKDKQQKQDTGGGGSGLWPSQVTGLFDGLDQAAGDAWGSVAGLFSPTPWIRAGAGLLASVVMVAGLWFLIRAAA